MTPKENAETPRLLEPCEHMENWVNGMADGSLKGPARWYTRLHVTTCSKCRAALTGLKDVHDRLNEMERAPKDNANAPAALTSERRAALENGMTIVEQKMPE